MAVKSAGESDPYFTQRQMATQRNRNAKNARIVSQLKATTAGKRPEFLKRAAVLRASGQDTYTPSDQIDEYKNSLATLGTKFMNRKK